MILEGNLELNPCTHILFQDPKELSTTKQAEGLQPILMMDDNDDWHIEEGEPSKTSTCIL